MNKKTKNYLIAGGVIAFVLIIILLTIKPLPFYAVSETEVAVITYFGKVSRVEKTAGLKGKIPVFEKVQKLPKWILEWDGEEKQFPTYDKRMIVVDATARWRISDVKQFYVSFTNVDGAVSKLDDILDAASREIVSSYTFEELVRDTPRLNKIKAFVEELIKDKDFNVEDERKWLLSEFERLEYTEKQMKTFPIPTILVLLEQGITLEELTSFHNITVGRNYLNQKMKEYAINELSKYGIEVIDFYVKKVNYIDENLQSVFENMSAERKKIAQKYRSEGENQRQKMLGDIHKDSQIIMAEAQKRSKQIKGEADATATKIYNNAYNRNSSTRDFYEFIKKMEMYKNMTGNTSLIISTDSEFFDMFKKID